MSNVQLTNRDVEILANGLRCLKDPKVLAIDSQKFADLMGFKTSGSANTLFNNVKRKIFAEDASGTISISVGGTPTKALAKAPKPQQGDGDDEVVQEEVEELVEPVQTPKKRGGRKAKAAPDATASPPPSVVSTFTAINADEVEGPESTPTHTKKRARATSATPGATAAKKRGKKVKTEQAEVEAMANPSDTVPGNIKVEDSAGDADGEEDADNNSEATTLVQGPTEEQQIFSHYMSMPGETAPEFPFHAFNFL